MTATIGASSAGNLRYVKDRFADPAILTLVKPIGLLIQE
jgi:hypothetical protein